MSYFWQPHSHSKNRIKLKLNLSRCTTKSDLNGAAGINTSNTSIHTDLASLKSDIDELDINKLKIVECY